MVIRTELKFMAGMAGESAAWPSIYFIRTLSHSPIWRSLPTAISRTLGQINMACSLSGTSVYHLGALSFPV